MLEQIAGVKIGRWLNVELPNLAQMRVDLLGRTIRGRRLIGFELQSFNDLYLPIRMAEYALQVCRLYGKFPEQYVILSGLRKLGKEIHSEVRQMPILDDIMNHDVLGPLPPLIRRQKHRRSVRPPPSKLQWQKSTSWPKILDYKAAKVILKRHIRLAAR